MGTAVGSAFEQACAAVDDGDLCRARALLEYARRSNPEDGRVALSLASVQIEQHDVTAIDLLRLVATRDSVRAAWHSLAAFQFQAGFSAPAAQDLSQLLGRYAPLRDPTARSAYDAIARRVGAPGWSGVTANGRLTISLACPPEVIADMTPNLAVDLDGKVIECRPAGPNGRMTCKLPSGWQMARWLHVQLAGRPFLGSPHAIAAIARTEGVTWSSGGELEGWAWMPGDPDVDPVMIVRSLDAPGKFIRILATTPCNELDGHAPLARPRRWHVPAAKLAPLGGAVEVVGTDGRQLYGAPLNPAAEHLSAAAASHHVRRLWPVGSAKCAETPIISLPATPADIVGAAPEVVVERRGVDVVIPVYGGLDLTCACLAQVRATVGATARIVVVDDASPDPDLAAALDAQARDGLITLVRLPRNRGFPAAANAGMRLGSDRDVVLLNSDTVVPEGWLQRLQDAAYKTPNIGTVTPLSNNATILSYPSIFEANAMPSVGDVARLDAVAQAANAGEAVEIPTAVGFCMYVRRDCLEAVGGFREDVFAQGYGEENDFCIRARHLGWRHMALAGLYVGHVGGQSFSAAKHHLIKRNLRLVNRLHPGYDALIAAFQAADPLAPLRRRMDGLRWREGRSNRGAVVLVGHAAGGGVLRRLLERCVEIRSDGLRPVLLLPATAAGGARRIAVSEGKPGTHPNLIFAVPDEQAQLVALLQAEQPTHLEMHHWIGHDASVFDLACQLNVPYDVVLHDYAWFCPRVTLTRPDGRYCGEPALLQCEACVRDNGGCVDEAITPTELRQRSRTVLAGARRLTAPSQDTARRLARMFERLNYHVEELEDDALAASSPRQPRRSAGVVRVCLNGGISQQKGYNYLLDCARDVIARKLPIRFSLVGYTCDDDRLLETGIVSITGPYEETEAEELIRMQNADVGFLPALWPETWSYTLSHMWKAGLDVFAFNIGAPAERIARSRRGVVLPLGLSSEKFNDTVLATIRG